MGDEKITRLYVVSYHVVDFKSGPLEVYLQQALSLKPNYKVAGLVSRI
jgi:hypothetical protein